METQRLWNKVHSTSYTQEQEGWIRLCQKTFKRACAVLKRQKVFVKIETNINLHKNDRKRNIWRRKRTPHEHKAYHVICHAGDAGAKVVSHLWCYMNAPQQCINTGHSDLSPKKQTDVPVL